MSDRMTLEEYHEMNRTGKLPRRFRSPTRLEVLERVADVDPALAEKAAKRRSGNKYGAIPTEVDGIKFASKKEARRYEQLRLRERARDIHDLEVHPAYVLEVNGVRIGRYTADFRYTDAASGEQVVEDVKGGRATKSEAYGLRKRLMLAVHGIKITEV